MREKPISPPYPHMNAHPELSAIPSHPLPPEHPGLEPDKARTPWDYRFSLAAPEADERCEPDDRWMYRYLFLAIDLSTDSPRERFTSLSPIVLLFRSHCFGLYNSRAVSIPFKTGWTARSTSSHSSSAELEIPSHPYLQ